MGNFAQQTHKSATYKLSSHEVAGCNALLRDIAFCDELAEAERELLLLPSNANQHA
ncbi:hypothetical protein [Cellvibrio sp. OA-2007]|uniref:hypothetical protein n=1 Tax=Cellvibrio sp. OA-2007 TaxID=529823 RepID=UPI000B05075A|nr:hypothetical protein [Cellvibrio sp. OA-2007]